jgi:hypothetical protein
MSRRAFSQRRPGPSVLSSRKPTEGCRSSESHNTAGWVRRSRKNAGRMIGAIAYPSSTMNSSSKWSWHSAPPNIRFDWLENLSVGLHQRAAEAHSPGYEDTLAAG